MVLCLRAFAAVTEASIWLLTTISNSSSDVLLRLLLAYRHVHGAETHVQDKHTHT